MKVPFELHATVNTLLYPGPLQKVVLLGIQLYAVSLTLTPPTTPPTPDEKQHFREKDGTESAPIFMKYAGRAVKVVLYGLTSVEMALITAAVFPRLLTYIPEPISTQVLGIGTKLSLSAPFSVGHALVMAGTAVRHHCYRRMHDRFTFELAFRKDHKLETGGLYSVVRHPAYTGALMFIAGTNLCVCDGGSLLAMLGVWETWWGDGIRAAMLSAAILAAYSFVDRTRVEDEALRQRFREEWTKWAERTPYKLIPYIF